MMKGHPDPTHMMASSKVRYGFYIAVWVLSAMIYYMVQFRYMTEEAPKRDVPADAAGGENPQKP